MPRTAPCSHQANSQPSDRLDQRSADQTAPLFVYGSLQFPDVLRALLGRVPSTAAARVNGWCVRALPDVVYPGLVAAEGEWADGLVIDGLTPAEWRIIDAFENDVYDLRLLRLAGGHDAWAYICREASHVSDNTWDRRHFTESHLAEYVQNCIAWRARNTRKDLPTDDVLAGHSTGPTREP